MSESGLGLHEGRLPWAALAVFWEGGETAGPERVPSKASRRASFLLREPQGQLEGGRCPPGLWASGGHSEARGRPGKKQPLSSAS